MPTEDGWLRGKKAIAAYLDVTPCVVRRFWKQYCNFPAMFDGRKMVAKKSDIDSWLRGKAKRMCPIDGNPCAK